MNLIYFIINLSIICSGILLNILAINYKCEDVHDTLIKTIYVLCGSLLFLLGLNNIFRI